MKISQKLILGFGISTFMIGIVGFLSVNLSRQIFGLRSIELPMEQNLREVEVSIWEAIHAANAFRETGDGIYERLYYRQIDDVDKFYPKYEDLTNTSKERAYILEFNDLWQAAKSAGERMMQLTKKQKVQEKLFFEAVDGADDVLDYDIQAKWSVDDPDLLAKEQAVREVEVSIWEAIHAAHQYLGLSGNVLEFENRFEGGHKEVNFNDLMVKQFGDIDEFWPQFKALAKSDWEITAIKKFDKFWGDGVKAGNKLIALYDEAEKQFDILYKKVDESDDVIDYKMQTYIQKRIEKEYEIARGIKTTTIFVVLLAFLITMGIGLVISRSISKSITDLKDSASEIGKGNLEVRAQGADSNDEIGDLAKTFNEMAKKLAFSQKELENKAKILTANLEEVEAAKKDAEETTDLMLGREEKMQSLIKEIEELKKKRGEG